MRYLWILSTLSLAAPAHAQDVLNVVHPLPPQTPAWLVGYQVRWPVRVCGEPIHQESKTVIVSLPGGGRLKADGSDVVAQSPAGQVLPVVVLSHDPLGDTIVQFKRHGNEPWYWVYGINPRGATPKIDPKTDKDFREGVTIEVRDWAGDDLSSWAKVRAGLEKSTHIIGNAVVAEVVQNCNPARPAQSQRFTASYRGFLDIKKEGTYSFFVNADDAAFLFIDDFKVFERPGVNTPLGAVKVKELEKLAGKVELKPGVHSFEVHHAVGEHPPNTGRCSLVWKAPDQPKVSFLPPTAIAHPLYARAATCERPDSQPAGAFLHGLDDSLESAGLKLFLVRFEAEGSYKEPEKLVWNFGDGTTGKGQSITHVYLKEGDYEVSLSAPTGLPPFRRKINVWSEPGETSPLSLERAVKTLEAMEWRKLEPARVREIFSFLTVCDQPDRWRLLEQVAGHLLDRKDIDLEARSQFAVARMDALTQLGKAADALKVAEQLRPSFSRTPALQVRVELAAAAIHQYHYKDATAASKIYKAILDEHGRTEHPNLRLAGIRWGDLFAEAGDLTRASETYRIAATLGGDKFSATAQTDASTRGALMRIAEQKLKGGEILQTRQLLERIELEYPGRRLDGLYCFLRAETDRLAGRYEEALRNYEMIFKLPQWAGYRDRATYGIADSYRRMDELDKSLKWFGNLKEVFPKFYEAHKGAELEKLIKNRLERVKAPGKADQLFAGFHTGFEPEELASHGDIRGFAVVRGPGISGPHAALFDTWPRPGTAYEYYRPLKNLSPGGTYWGEVWYRDLVHHIPPPGMAATHVHMRLIAETPGKEETLSGPFVPRNTHQQWHKLSFKLKVPLAQDFLLRINFNNFTGAYLLDGLALYPVSDRQLDSLINFQEAAKGP